MYGDTGFMYICMDTLYVYMYGDSFYVYMYICMVVLVGIGKGFAYVCVYVCIYVWWCWLARFQAWA